MSKPQITITFGSLEPELRRQAAKMDCSVAALVRKAVQEFLDKINTKEE